MKTLAALALAMALASSSPALSQSIDCSTLSVKGASSAETTKLESWCKDLESSNSGLSTEQLSDYAELGQKYGTAISEVAKSVGTTVNELAFTPVGVFLLAIVGWKVIGQDIVGIVFGSIWFAVMIPIWLVLFNRLVLKRLYFVEERFDEKGKRIYKSSSPTKGDPYVGPLIFGAMACMFGICIAGFVMIF